MDKELLARINKAFDEHPSLAQTDQLLHELAVIRRKDPELHRLADMLLDHRAGLTG